MVVYISNNTATVIERGVYYLSTPNYPHISTLELKNLLAFIEYEKLYGRQTEIVCENASTLAAVNNAIAHPEKMANSLLPAKIIGCTACSHHGCLTEFVYHATDLKATQQILSGGKLLSAVKVYGKSGEELSYEKRDSPWNDPADFFEYIMFCWGNCIVGDYVVMSDTPDGEQNEESEGDFKPGVRFYFRYADVIQHPGHVFDGYHAIKVKEEIILSDYLHACIVPEQYKKELEYFILPELAARVYFLPQNRLGIFEWSERVYDFISELQA